MDADNDRHPGRCIGEHPAGWWTNRCDRSTINIDTNGIWNAATNDGHGAAYEVVSSRMLVKLD